MRKAQQKFREKIVLANNNHHRNAVGYYSTKNKKQYAGNNKLQSLDVSIDNNPVKSPANTITPINSK